MVLRWAFLLFILLPLMAHGQGKASRSLLQILMEKGVLECSSVLGENSFGSSNVFADIVMTGSSDGGMTVINSATKKHILLTKAEVSEVMGSQTAGRTPIDFIAAFTEPNQGKELLNKILDRVEKTDFKNKKPGGFVVKFFFDESGSMGKTLPTIHKYTGDDGLPRTIKPSNNINEFSDLKNHIKEMEDQAKARVVTLNAGVGLRMDLGIEYQKALLDEFRYQDTPKFGKIALHLNNIGQLDTYLKLRHSYVIVNGQYSGPSVATLEHFAHKLGHPVDPSVLSGTVMVLNRGNHISKITVFQRPSRTWDLAGNRNAVLFDDSAEPGVMQILDDQNQIQKFDLFGNPFQFQSKNDFYKPVFTNIPVKLWEQLIAPLPSGVGLSFKDLSDGLKRFNELSQKGDPLFQSIPGHQKGDLYRLPTEAEWEYIMADTPTNPNDYVWYPEEGTASVNRGGRWWKGKPIGFRLVRIKKPD